MARPRLETPNFRLVQRGGRFFVRWWDGARDQRISARTTDQREARRFLAQFVAGFATPEPPASPTIDAILDGYLADRKERVASYETLETCATALRRHLGDLQPDHLTRERSRFYVRRRRAEGYEVGPKDKRRRKPVSDGTIIRELVTLRAALRWALRERWITDEPYVETPSQPPARDRWMTREEAAALLEGARAQHIRVFMALALHTAGRSGAILALTWPDVDLERRTVDLGRGRGNKRRAMVPINDDLLAVLEEAREARTCDYVVERGGRRIASVKTGVRAAAARAGLAGITPHVFRHTAATWMVQGGRSFEEVADFLGNRAEMIERVYRSHSPGWLREAAAILGTPSQKTPERNAKSDKTCDSTASERKACG